MAKARLTIASSGTSELVPFQNTLIPQLKHSHYPNSNTPIRSSSFEIIRSLIRFLISVIPSEVEGPAFHCAHRNIEFLDFARNNKGLISSAEIVFSASKMLLPR